MNRLWLGTLFLLLALDIGLFFYWRNYEKGHRYDRTILHAARRYNVDPALVKAVMWKESRFKAAARGAAGEIGLMQLRNLAAQEWAEAEEIPSFSHEHVSDPYTNALAGTWYLSKMLKRYKDKDNPLPYALADYNAGRSNVLRWLEGEARTNSKAFLKKMDFPGTRQYIKEITERYHYYRGEFD